MVPYRDSNLLKERLAALLDGLSPDTKKQIYSLTNFSGESVESLLARDCQKIMTTKGETTSIQDLFTASHDGADTSRPGIREELAVVGRGHGRQPEPN